MWGRKDGLDGFDGEMEEARTRLIRRDEAEKACISRLVERLGRRPRGTTRIELVLDASGSVGQEVMDLLCDRGLPMILGQIRENAASCALQAIVRVTVFSDDVRELISWTPVEDALEAVGLLRERARGVTRLDLALEDAIDAMVRMKRAEDEARQRGALKGGRKGSVIMVLTDGRITDDGGRGIEVPRVLSERISELQRERAMQFLAIGVGESDPRQLSDIAPATREGGRQVAHALHYAGKDGDLDWTAVCRFIAEGSSGPTRGFTEEAVVSHSDFELVF